MFVSHLDYKKINKNKQLHTRGDDTLQIITDVVPSL